MLKNLKIGLVDKSDIKDVFDLSNDTAVRKNSFNQNKIEWSDHVNWFFDKIKNQNSIFYSVKTLKNDFVGYVRFDKQQILDNLENIYIITIHLIENFRGKGIGGYLIKESSKKILNNNRNSKIYAYVKKDNRSSVNAFLKNGYKFLEYCKINGIECFKLICKL